ncbi:TPA: hypothetical protein ACH3X2_006704 [Trebouxia sp. C0005]
MASGQKAVPSGQKAMGNGQKAMASGQKAGLTGQTKAPPAVEDKLATKRKRPGSF